ncbi:hypothetical protein [Lactococcus termiticola]|uniref:Uncharacterized protein n=1 Tax=Lactococcus termiticola TaxID=2169526 RepID=A0A2R5HJ17_9LACT|nr:hypothetical protein [Lactococcus termiticola]GBG96458.1 hypothetical protein NtB2_00570 [Lactococcus termiticola]
MENKKKTAYSFERLIDKVKQRREVEFSSRGKDYIISYYPTKSGKPISFYELDKWPNEYADLEDFVKHGNWEGRSIQEIWAEAEDILIF